MATRKTTARRTPKKPSLKSASKGAGKRMPVSVAFRIFVLIVIIIAFFMILPVIKNLRQNATAAETEQGTENREQGTDSNNKEQVAGSKERDKREEITGNKEQITEGKKPQTEKPAVTEQQEKKPVASEQPNNKPQTEKPVAPAQPSTPTAPVSTPPVKPVETRGSIYLIQESNKMLVKLNRNLNPNTPLTDSINALLAGPTPDEIMRGIESFVPEGSKLLKPPTIKGNTVELDFNQEFRYNTRGSEGCAAQIKQIVWTATEFPNIWNVQFLIEGKKVDFLSEGVVISSPIGR